MKTLTKKVNKQHVFSIFVFTLLVLATVGVVLYGKGYRFGFDSGKPALKGTGLLVVKSLPDGAQVFVDGKLKTATDNTINLAPGEYSIKIAKAGYFPWEKRITIDAEIVSTAEALLIPTAPKLENITEVGAINPMIDPTLTKIAYSVSSQSASKNGIYIYDMKANPLILQNSSSQIVDDSADLFSESMFSWSPDGKDLIATISSALNPEVSNSYLLDTDRGNNPPNNVTATLEGVNASWTKLQANKDKANLNSMPKKMRTLAKENFNILSFSPDQNKILYEASRSATLPVIITPRLIGANSTPEQRTITKGQIYVYDTKEDRNYEMDEANFKGAYSWFTNNRNIIFVKDKALHMIDFDGANDVTVYAGPFIENYVFPWPDATRIVVLTNLGNNMITPNLYTISLK